MIPDDGRASEFDLAELHGEYIQQLRAQLAKYKEDGEPIPAAVMKEIRELLRDNHIECDRSSRGNIISLADEAPNFDDDDDAKLDGKVG